MTYFSYEEKIFFKQNGYIVKPHTVILELIEQALEVIWQLSTPITTKLKAELTPVLQETCHAPTNRISKHCSIIAIKLAWQKS